jgi:hypothetical protein
MNHLRGQREREDQVHRDIAHWLTNVLDRWRSPLLPPMRWAIAAIDRLLGSNAALLPRHRIRVHVGRVVSPLHGMRCWRNASATAWVRLRAPSLLCTFFKWLRTVSSPRFSSRATSRDCIPAETSRKTANSRGVKRPCAPTMSGSDSTSWSRRSAAKLTAAQTMTRIECVTMLASSLRDQKHTTHRPPTGQVNPSRIPCFNATSYDHLSIPIGWNMRLTSVHLITQMLPRT